MENEKSGTYWLEIGYHPDKPPDQRWTFNGSSWAPLDPYLIRVDRMVYLLVFELKADPNHKLEFADPPLEWVDADNASMPQPGVLWPIQLTPARLALLNHNIQPGEQRYRFRVKVFSDGEHRTSPDPTIVNQEPPSSPRPEGREEERALAGSQVR